MTSTDRTSLYERLREAIEAGIPVSTVTVVRGDGLGAKLLVLPETSHGTLGEPDLDRQAVDLARELVGEERSETRSLSSKGRSVDLFFESFPPPPVLLIFGAVHVGQALSRMASLLGYRVIVSDARAKLATADRFPDADQILQEWPEETLARLTISPTASIAILTHDPKFDEPALLGALQTPARYIGAVGSRSTSADRRERLKAAGVSDADLDRIHGPIGLDIGASTPEEMAISILAEMIAVKHDRSGGRLTSAEGNIRARV